MNCYYILGKDIGVASCSLLHSFEFRVIILDWLPPKAREPKLLCYLTHSWVERKWIHVFHMLMIMVLAVQMHRTLSYRTDYYYHLNEQIFNIISNVKMWSLSFHLYWNKLTQIFLARWVRNNLWTLDWYNSWKCIQNSKKLTDDMTRIIYENIMNKYMK